MRLPLRKRLPYLGVLLAFALILSYVETIIPFEFGIPGVKLGLSNMAVLLCLYVFKPQDAILISLTKACLASLLFGNVTMLIYSLSGAIFSILIMLILKHTGLFHLPVISAVGAVFHNLGQLLIAYIIMQSKGLLYYGAFLILIGLVIGLILGYLASLLVPRIKEIVH